MRQFLIGVLCIFFLLFPAAGKTYFQFKSDVQGISIDDGKVIHYWNAHTQRDEYSVSIQVTNTTQDHILIFKSLICFGDDGAEDDPNCDIVYFGRNFPSGTTNWSDAQYLRFGNRGPLYITILKIQTIMEDN